MEIQGGEEAIEKVIQAIQAGQYVWIHGMDVTPMCPEPEESGFHTS